ncbi:hypothetical protein ACFE33_15230 (plasmid) [Falsihalocynthiibacter sp. SS001]|uniref:hypothetical protein n=1 Tax=Falsihalocynthiibacter sp. SS001 TaxID=3349698 RepID=UPI0036D4132E
MINAAIGLHLFLLLAFDYVPAGGRLALAGGINLLYVFAMLAHWSNNDDRRDVALLFPIVCYCLIGLIAFAFSPSNEASATTAVRQLSPYVALVALITCSSRISEKLIIFSALTILISAAVHAAFQPRVYLNNSWRFAPFSTNLHATGYALVAAFLVYWSQRGVAFRTATVLCLLLLLGNGVRTPLLFLVAYLFFEWLLRNRFFRENLGILLATGAVSILAMIAISLTIDLTNFNDFSSGRLSNYAERLELLNQRGITELLFGSGPGTDLLRTSTWWWDAKDSHSDILKVLWEGGFLGLLAFIWFWALVALRGNGALLALVLAILVASMVSNAYLSRPNSAFLLFAAGAIRLTRNQNDLPEQLTRHRELQTQ